MWILFSYLISRQSRINHVRKIRILLIFSWVNDFRKKISTKNNIKRFTKVVVKYVVVQFLRKKTCVLTEICCLLLAFIFPDLVWCWWHIIKQIFHAFFCLISKLFTFGNIINYLRWIISDIQQKGMEYLLNIKQKGM